MGFFLFLEGVGQQPPAPEAFARAVFGDTAVATRTARSACRWVPASRRRACYAPLLEALARRHPAFALEVLGRLGTADRAANADGHALSHAIGSAAWDAVHDLPGLMQSCLPRYQAGCYHGVIQGALTAAGQIDSQVVIQLCQRAVGPSRSAWLPFQCLHGLGHGLVMTQAGDLRAGLRECDWLPDEWGRQVCYGGAFMENVGGHEHHGSARDDSVKEMAEHWQPRQAGDLLYPCSVLDARYGYACYQNQGAIILEANGVNFPAAARTCLDAPDAFQDPCLTGLGVSANAAAEGDPAAARALCARWPVEQRKWCYAGAARNQVDVTASTGAGITFCEGVPAVGDREFCLIAAQSEGLLFEKSP